MNQFMAKFSNVDLGPKNGAFAQFWAKQKTFSKWASYLFSAGGSLKIL